jgi:hypothetical protein
LEVKNGARVQAPAGVVNLAGLAGEVKLNNAPVTILQWAAFAVPDDWAQSGTDQLAAGTRTITVPYYDNTLQRVTASYVGIPTNPGSLYVVQTNTTHFDVKSTSGTDVSNFNWAISPRGRGISFAAL